MRLLVLTDRDGGDEPLLPALQLLSHDTVMAGLAPDTTLSLGDVDVVLVDATMDLRPAMAGCRRVATHDLPRPIIVVAVAATLPVLHGNWGFDDWLLRGATAGEVEARLRLAIARRAELDSGRSCRVGDLVVDEESYQVSLRGTPLDLTYKEFELLKTLAGHPNRVFSRELLLNEVWGWDYYGGSRTIDVHIRRLRAKFGPEHDQLIETVRGVGYKLVSPDQVP